MFTDNVRPITIDLIEDMANVYHSYMSMNAAP